MNSIFTFVQNLPEMCTLLKEKLVALTESEPKVTVKVLKQQ